MDKKLLFNYLDDTYIIKTNIFIPINILKQ